MRPIVKNARHFAPFTALLLATVSCGAGIPPTVSEITLSRTEIARGETFFAMTRVTDADEDLVGGRVHVKFVQAAEDDRIEFESSMDIAGRRFERPSVDLVVQLQVLGDMDLGAYKLWMVVEDDAGNESEPVSANIVVDG